MLVKEAPEQKDYILQMTISNASLEWKCVDFDSNFAEICSQDDTSALVEAIAWDWTKKSHYLNQWYPSSMKTHGVNKFHDTMI